MNKHWFAVTFIGALSGRASTIYVQARDSDEAFALAEQVAPGTHSMMLEESPEMPIARVCVQNGVLLLRALAAESTGELRRMHWREAPTLRSPCWRRPARVQR